MHPRTPLARRLHALHQGPRPLLLFNAWDAGSARTIAGCGVEALATSSWSVAAAHGLPDGEQLPLEATLETVARIATVSDLPLTVDLERGYDDPADTVARAIDAGAVGGNLEDGLVSGVRPLDEQAARLVQARAAADAAGLSFYINARTDLFLQRPAETHDAALVDDALTRAQAYAAAGASGLFVPGLVDPALIERVVQRSPLPVNIMWVPGCPAVDALARLGVARVSHGPGPYLAAMQALTAACLEARGAAAAT